MTKSEIAALQESARFPKGLLVAASLVVVAWGAKAGQDLFVPLLLSAMLAFMAAPLVRALRRLHAPNWMAVIVAALILVVPLAAAGYGMARQVQTLITDYPRILAFLDERLRTIVSSEWAHRIGVRGTLTTADLTAKLSDKAGEGLQFAMTALQALLAATSEAVLVVLFALSMLASREHLDRCAQRILARWEGIEGAKMLDASTTLVEQFLLTKMAIAAAYGVVSGLSLWACGIKYSYLLGAIGGALTLLPEVGFLISLVPVIVVALATDVSLATTAVALATLLGIHVFEANVLAPRFVGRRVNLNALATFVGLFAGGLLWGVWGMFLSVPILGVARIVFSVSPALAPWGDLLAERDDSELAAALVSRSIKAAWKTGKSVAAAGVDVTVKVKRARSTQPGAGKGQTLSDQAFAPLPPTVAAEIPPATGTNVN